MMKLLLQNNRLCVCLFVIVLLTLITMTAASKRKKGVDEDDATVEEISEEEYKEQQKQEARQRASKPDTTRTPRMEDTPQPETKEGSKSKDTKPEPGKTAGTPEPGKTAGIPEPGKTATPPETAKEESIKAEADKSEKAVEPEISESQGVFDEDGYELAQPPVEEEEEEQPEEEHEAPSGIRDPRRCEVCKYLAVELQGRLVETGKVKEYIETGHGIMPGDRKRKDYKKSELRFIEALNEPHVCDKILDYDIHAERKKSLRYAKGQSETRKTLHWLRMKGVKVEMGMPEEMWTGDGPSSEITHLQRLCIDMVEMHEEALEDWYWGHQEQHLYVYLCKDRALKNDDQECLKEEFGVSQEKKEEEEESETSKGDNGVPSSAMPPEGDPASQDASADASHTASTPQSPSSDSATPKTEL